MKIRAAMAVLLLIGLAMPVRAADNMISEWPNSLILSIHQPERPNFSGVTGLPDGTSLLVTLRRIGVWSLDDRAHYAAQSSSKVLDGKFMTESFTDQSADLKPGKYLIEIGALVPPDLVDPARQVYNPAPLADGTD